MMGKRILQKKFYQGNLLDSFPASKTYLPKAKRGEEGIFNNPPEVKLDFDKEAMELLKYLGINDPKVNRKKASVNEPDIVYIHPVTHAKLFIGSYIPASTLEILEKYQIFHIVDCRGNDGECYYQKD